MKVISYLKQEFGSEHMLGQPVDQEPGTVRQLIYLAADTNLLGQSEEVGRPECETEHM